MTEEWPSTSGLEMTKRLREWLRDSGMAKGLDMTKRLRSDWDSGMTSELDMTKRRRNG